MPAIALPDQIVVRLGPEARDALASVLESIKVPHRRAPSISEAVRAALVTAAKAMGADNTTALTKS